MKNVTCHTGTLTIIQREPSSQNGNPRFLVMLDGYTAKTTVDSMEGYNIQNLDGREVSAQIGTHYGTRSIQNINPV